MTWKSSVLKAGDGGQRFFGIGLRQPNTKHHLIVLLWRLLKMLLLCASGGCTSIDRTQFFRPHHAFPKKRGFLVKITADIPVNPEG